LLLFCNFYIIFKKLSFAKRAIKASTEMRENMGKVKRIAAVIGIILIASLYLISFISAFFAKENAAGFFMASVFSTIVIPIMIYAYIAVYKHVHKNDKQNSSTDIPTSDQKHK
jgi:Na+/melibiose symporter-like transporter